MLICGSAMPRSEPLSRSRERGWGEGTDVHVVEYVSFAARISPSSPTLSFTRSPWNFPWGPARDLAAMIGRDASRDNDGTSHAFHA